MIRCSMLGDLVSPDLLGDSLDLPSIESPSYNHTVCLYAIRSQEENGTGLKILGKRIAFARNASNRFTEWEF
jgi:hypothetical protein